MEGESLELWRRIRRPANVVSALAVTAALCANAAEQPTDIEIIPPGSSNMSEVETSDR